MSTQRTGQRTGVFISYSHADSDWLDKLKVHLHPLERDFALTIWDDKKIKAGEVWNKKILDAIDNAGVAVLLISANFFNSDFIVGEELPRLLKAAEDDGARIISLILGPSRYERTPSLSRFQSFNPPSRPMLGMKRKDQEDVFNRLAKEIEATLMLSKAMNDLSSGVNVMNQTVPVVSGQPAKQKYRRYFEGQGARVVSTLNGQVMQTITKEDLKNLPCEIFRHVSILSKDIEGDYARWEKLIDRRAKATSKKKVAELDAEEYELKVRLAGDLKQVLDFLEDNGMILDDHYLSVRDIAKQVTGSGN